MSWHASRTLRPLLALFPSILETTPESLWPYVALSLISSLSFVLYHYSLFFSIQFLFVWALLAKILIS
jgi:hypothetical protein